jgi:hypothetical protein
MFLSPGHPARPHRFLPLNPIVWTPVRGLSNFSPEHDGSASRSCRRKKDGRRRTRTCARAYEWIHHIHHCPRSQHRIWCVIHVYIRVHLHCNVRDVRIWATGTDAASCAEIYLGKYFYRSIFTWTWFHSRTICFSKSITVTHICICVLLPPFRNIRCFSFIKLMYLDTF